jgi:hypothetical protein
LSFSSTGSALYESFLICKITIKSLDRSTTYYTYNSNSPSATNPTIYCSIQLGINQHGSFDIQIINDDNLDTALITSGARCYIELGKEGTFTTVLSGMIRSHGYSRGCENDLLLNLTGYGSGIRLNERIIDWITKPTKLEDDGVTIDQTDSNFFADSILDDTLDRAARFPSDVTSSTVEGTGGYGHIDTSTTQADSEIHDFMIPTNRFEEAQSVANLIQDYTLSRVYIDTNDKPQLHSILTPSSANYGFLITNVMDRTNNNGDNTMYIDSASGYEFQDHISKDMGYSSKLYGILSADQKPAEDFFDTDANFYDNKTVEIAQLIRPPSNQGWELYAGVSIQGVNNTNATGAVRSRWRLCEDDHGKPRNNSGIIKNKYVDQFNTGDVGDADSIHTVLVMTSKAIDTSENEKYWLILSSVNSTATEWWRWYHNNSSVGGQVATASTGTSSDTNGGSGWTVSKKGPLMFWTGIRAKAEPYTILDDKAVRKRIQIDSNIPSFPPQITDRISAQKYMVMKATTSARPKRVYSFSRLTMPNKPVFPGDIAIIQDSTLNLSTTGNVVSAGQITDITYNFGIKGGGDSMESKGENHLNLNVVGYPTSY